MCMLIHSKHIFIKEAIPPIFQGRTVRREEKISRKYYKIIMLLFFSALNDSERICIFHATIDYLLQGSQEKGKKNKIKLEACSNRTKLQFHINQFDRVTSVGMAVADLGIDFSRDNNKNNKIIFKFLFIIFL